MDDMQKTMKHLQRTTEKLGNLSFDHKNPFQMLGEMQHIFDDEFWEQVERLNRYTERRKRNTNDQAGDFPRDLGPRIDIFETRAKVVVCCDLPGLDKNSLNVTLSEGRHLTLEGRIKAHDFARDERLVVNKERFHGKFIRQIELPCQVQTEDARKVYKSGVLELYFPKSRNRNIREVKLDWSEE